MKTTVVAALCLLSAAGCGDEEKRAPRACEDHCNQQAAAGCPQPVDAQACIGACQFFWDAGMCQDEWRAMITCSAGATWTCDEVSGYPVHEGVECQEEGTAFGLCSEGLD